MKIIKILNNNAVVSHDESKSEVIVMGKGIAYGKKQGEEIAEERIKKIFILNNDSKNRIIQLLEKIPTEYLEVSQMIISRAKNVLNQELNDNIYVSLTDHIYMAIQRYNEGIILKNKLLWEIKKFYPKEYKISLESLNTIEAMFGIKMGEDEAGFIAIHIVSSENDNEIDDFYELTKTIQDILNIVKYYFKMDFNESSLHYQRFITHLKFICYRIISGKNEKKRDLLKNDLLEIIKEKYVEPYLCSLKIKHYVEKRYDYILDDDEIMYLLIHISQVLQDSKGGEDK